MDDDQLRMDEQLIIDELTACCNSLGKIDENDGTYMKDRDCKPCLREIARYLSADTKSHVSRTLLGSMNIIDRDLIPLLTHYCDFNDGDHELFNLIIRICTNLTTPALLLFENNEIPKESEQYVLYNKIQCNLYDYKMAFAVEPVWSILNVHLRHNKDDEDIVFERLIVLIRNVLHIPLNATTNTGIQSDYDAQEALLSSMEKSGLLGTLIEISSGTKRGAEYCFHLMEIVYLMFRDQNPQTIAQAQKPQLRRKLAENDPDKVRYAELRKRDILQRQAQRPVYNRYKNSAFVVKNVRGVGENPIIVSRPIQNTTSIRFDDSKTELRKSKNRKPLSFQTSMDISDNKTSSSKVSYSLKVFCKLFVEKVYNDYMLQMKHNLIQKKAQEDDESSYLWAIQFFTSFNRHLNLNVDNISETLSSSTLHFIQMLIQGYQEKITVEKKVFDTMTKRLHLGLRAYKEILKLIQSIDEESEFSDKIQVIQRNIFSETDYSSLMMMLFKQYAEHKHTLHYTRDLIETNEIFIELYDKYCSKHGQPHKILDVVDDDEDSELDDSLGQVKPTSDDELDPKSLRKAMKAKTTKKKKKNNKGKGKGKSTDLRTAHFVSLYAHPDVMNVYHSILKLYRQNSDSTNDSILRFLERMTYDCKYDLLLCQASLIMTMMEISEDPTKPKCQAKFKDLAVHLIGKFGTLANKKKWMVQELLFWKTANDVCDIETAIDPPPEPVMLQSEDLDRAPMMSPENEDYRPSRLILPEDDEEDDDELRAEPPIERLILSDEARDKNMAPTNLEELMAELEDDNGLSDMSDLGDSQDSSLLPAGIPDDLMDDKDYRSDDGEADKCNNSDLESDDAGNDEHHSALDDHDDDDEAEDGKDNVDNDDDDEKLYEDKDGDFDDSTGKTDL